MINFGIYGLFHPETGELRYIGQTRKSLNKRLKNHLGHSKNIKTNRWVCSWIRKLLRFGLIPRIQYIQEYKFITNQDLNNAEIYWIKYFREQGCRLVNVTNGR